MAKNLIIKGTDFSQVVVDKVKFAYTIVDFILNNGQLYNLLTGQVVDNWAYWYTNLNIPSGYTSVRCRFPRTTGGGLGMEFRTQSGEKISSIYSTSGVDGTEMTVEIPLDATNFMFSYITDSHANIDGKPKFDGFHFFK